MTAITGRRSGASRPWSVAATAGVGWGRAPGGRWRIRGLRAAWLAGGEAMLRSRRDPGTAAGGHFAGMPARSLHARGAVTPGDTFQLPGWVA